MTAPDPFAPDEDDYETGTDIRGMVRSLRQHWDNAEKAPGRLEHIIYAGKTHSLTAPPETGKTVLALHLAIAAMRSNGGSNVLHWDEEIGPGVAAGLMSALGAEPELVDKHLTYVPFAGLSWNPRDRRGLHEMAGDLKPRLAIFDSSAAMMGMAGVNENDNGQVTRFWQQVWQPLAVRFGCAVVVIDHEGRETGGRYARGGTRKLDIVDVAHKLAPIVPFTRRQDGLLWLSVTKDRLGWMHRNWLIRVPHAPLRMRIERAQTGELSPAARRVLEVLDDRWLTLSDVGDAVADKDPGGFGLKRETISRAVSRLEKMGLASTGTNNGRTWVRRTTMDLADVLPLDDRPAPDDAQANGWPDGSEGAAANG